MAKQVAKKTRGRQTNAQVIKEIENQTEKTGSETERPKAEEFAPVEQTKQDNTKIDELQKGKVIEVETPKKLVEKVNQRPPQRKKRSKRFEVIVKGKSRMMSKPSFLAVVRDPKLEVTLPHGSELVEPQPKGCKDC